MIGLVCLISCVNPAQRKETESAHQGPPELSSQFKVLQQHLVVRVKESGPDMASTYSGFLDDGRFFVATQDQDEGTCMVTTPEDARKYKNSHESGDVGPIYLVEYADHYGGSFWEISQHTHPGDINFAPTDAKQTENEESCGVSIIFHQNPLE